jgi:hypothetical protein
LINRKCPKRIIAIIQSLFSGCSSSVIVNGVRSRLVNRKCGLLQGSILSPRLFNLYIDDLLHEVGRRATAAQRRNPAAVLLIADDIKAQMDTRAEAKTFLEICHAWALRKGMTWGHAKSGVIGLTPGAADLQLGGIALPRVETYTYVGFPFTSTGVDWSIHAKQLVSRGRRHLTALKSIPLRIVEGIRAEMWRMFGRSATEYGAGCVWIWLRHASKSRDKATRQLALEISTDFEKLHKEALSWILSPVAATQRTFAAGALVNLPPFSFRQEEIAWRTHEHLERTTKDNPVRRVVEYRKFVQRTDKSRASLTHGPGHAMLMKLAGSNLVREWKEMSTADPELTLKEFGRRRRAKHWQKREQVRASTIRPSTRTFAFMCPTTLLAHRPTRLRAIYWRLGLTFGTLHCRIRGCARNHAIAKGLRPSCVNAQTQLIAHLLQRCNLEVDSQRSKSFQRVPPDIVMRRFREARLQWTTMPEWVEDTHCILDHLLNTGDYTRFDFLLRHLAHTESLT